MIKSRYGVINKKRTLWWNATAATFLEYEQHSVFTELATAKAIAKENGGRVVNLTDYVCLTEYRAVVDEFVADGRVVDIICSQPTMAGNLSPILVSAIERALDRGNEVKLSWNSK